MMKRIVFAGIVLMGVVTLAARPVQPAEPEGVFVIQDPAQQRQDVRIDLRNPGTHPKVGVQTFTALGGAPLREIAETLTSVLAADLAFEREFYIVDRKASASIPIGATPQTLPFSQWEQIADFVLMGQVREQPGRLDVEVRLVSVKGKPGDLAFNRSYGGCTAAAVRFCAHSISDDMHKELRAVDGIARTRFAFVSDRQAEALQGRPIPNSGPGKEIYIADYDGHGQRRITTNRWLNLAPTWGPDGRTLAFTTFVSGRYPDIFVTMLDGRAPTRPAHGSETVHNHLPAISPDGRRVAFATSRAGNAGYFDIWVVDRDGRNLMNLTPGTERWSDSAPAWSPTGTHIAFTSDRTGTNQLYIMNADGTGVQRKTFAEKVDRPTWSAHNLLAYTLERPGSKVIAILDLGKNEPRILTDGAGSSEQPSIAPNGRHVAFVTTRWGKAQVATIGIDGNGLRQVTSAGNNTFPTWSPTPGGK
jgi:TolB protein